VRDDLQRRLEERKEGMESLIAKERCVSKQGREFVSKSKGQKEQVSKNAGTPLRIQYSTKVLRVASVCASYAA
jgi:hypothetical protein